MAGKNVYKSRYHAIKNALTAAEKALINYYELNWTLKSYVPTVEEVTEHLRIERPHLRQTSVNYYLTRQPVIKALEQRGIPFRQHTREELTDQQVSAAITVMNFADTRSNEDKLDELGILPATYYAWLNDPAFKNLVDSLADRNLTNIRPTAVAEFTKKINKGDWNAVKFWLETTGELTSKEAPQSEHLLRAIVEIIQKHVKDPETIIAIAQDIKLASANRTLEVATQPQAITGSVVEDDPELEHAKKQLGFG